MTVFTLSTSQYNILDTACASNFDCAVDRRSRRHLRLLHDMCDNLSGLFQTCNRGLCRILCISFRTSPFRNVVILVYRSSKLNRRIIADRTAAGNRIAVFNLCGNGSNVCVYRVTICIHCLEGQRYLLRRIDYSRNRMRSHDIAQRKLLLRTRICGFLTIHLPRLDRVVAAQIFQCKRYCRTVRNRIQICRCAVCQLRRGLHGRQGAAGFRLDVEGELIGACLAELYRYLAVLLHIFQCQCGLTVQIGRTRPVIRLVVHHPACYRHTAVRRSRERHICAFRNLLSGRDCTAVLQCCGQLTAFAAAEGNRVRITAEGYFYVQLFRQRRYRQSFADLFAVRQNLRHLVLCSIGNGLTVDLPFLYKETVVALGIKHQPGVLSDVLTAFKLLVEVAAVVACTKRAAFTGAIGYAQGVLLDNQHALGQIQLVLLEQRLHSRVLTVDRNRYLKAAADVLSIALVIIQRTYGCNCRRQSVTRLQSIRLDHQCALAVRCLCRSMLAVILIPGYIQLQRLALYRNGRGRQLGALEGITVILICRDDIGSRLLRSESAVSDRLFTALALTGLPPGVGDISRNLCFAACGNIVSVFRYSLLLHGQSNRRTVYARNLVFFANSAFKRVNGLRCAGLAVLYTLHACQIIYRLTCQAAGRGGRDGIQTGCRCGPRFAVRAAAVCSADNRADRAVRRVRNRQRVLHIAECSAVLFRRFRRQGQRRTGTRRRGSNLIFNRSFLCYQCERRIRITAQLRLLCAGQLGPVIAVLCLLHQLIILDSIGVLFRTGATTGRLSHCTENIAVKRGSVLRHSILTVNQVLLAVPVLAFVVFRVCRCIRCTVQRKRFCFCVFIFVFVFVYHYGFRRNCARHCCVCTTVLPLIGGLHGEFRTCGIRLAILCYGVVYGRYRTACFLLFTDADIFSLLIVYLVNIQRHAIDFYGARNGCRYGFCRGFNRVEIALTDIRGILSAAALQSTGYRQTGGCLRCTNRQRCRITVERNRRSCTVITCYHATVHRTVQVTRYRLYGIAVLSCPFNIAPLFARQTLLPLVSRAAVLSRYRSQYFEGRRAVHLNGYVIRSVDVRTALIICQSCTGNNLAFNRFFLTGVISRGNRIPILRIRCKILQRVSILTTRRFSRIHSINQYERFFLIIFKIAVNLVILCRTVAGFPRQHHAVGGLLTQRQILRRRRRCRHIADNIAQYRYFIAVERYRPCAEAPVKVIARIAAAGNRAQLGNLLSVYLFGSGACSPVITAASLEAANYTIHLHRTLIGVLKVYAAAGCSRKTLQLCTRIFVMTNFTGLLRMGTARQTGTISIRLTGRAQMQVAANLLHILVRRSSLIISIYRNHVHRRITRNRQRHRTGQLRRIALLCAIRILHLILVICHRCCIHEHHIVVRIIRILDRYFLACRFCCTNSKGMTGIKFNTAAGLNQRCNIFKARHDIKTKRTGCRYCYSIILTVSDSGLRVSDIAVIHLRKMRRRLQNRHYLRVGVAGADAFDLREHGIVVYICRCKRQIAVALVIVCPVILPAAERAASRAFVKLTDLQKLLIEGLLLAVLNVVYLFHALLVAVKIADSIVQNTAVVDESAAQPAVMALIRAVQDRQLLTAVHRADFIHTAGNEQIFLGVHAVRCNSRYRDRILHIVTLGAGIGKAIGDNFCCLAFFCPRLILRVRAVLIAVRQQLARVKVAVLVVSVLIVVANRNDFRRHAAARLITDITDGYTRKASTAACTVIAVQQLLVHHLLPAFIVVVIVNRQIGFLVVGMTVIRFLLQVIDIDRHCQLVDTVHIHVADFHINAQMRTQLVIAVAVVVQHGLQRLSAAVNYVTEVDYATLVSQFAAAERILLNAVYRIRFLVIARRIDHQRVLAVAVKVACGQTQHSAGLVEFQFLDVFTVVSITNLDNV